MVIPRLQKVVAGEPAGIGGAVDWQGGGGFRFLELAAPLFDASGDIHAGVKFADLAAFIWMCKTGAAPSALAPGTPRLGVHQGILGDCRPAGSKVLTNDLLAAGGIPFRQLPQAVPR